MPLTTDPAFIGHQFRHDGTRYTIHRKTANKRGGTSWIWRWNTLDDKRTKLGSAVFEATELEKHWMKAGLGDDLGPSGHLSGAA